MTGCEHILAGANLNTVGKVTEPEQALETYKLLKPDAVVLDIRFGHEQLTGIDVAKKLLDFDERAKIVVFSQSDQFETIEQCFKLGVSAFLTKDAEPDELIKAITKAVKGERYVSEHISSQVVANMSRPEVKPRELLSDLELEIVRMVSAGKTLREIGAHFGRSGKWAHTAVKKIKDRLCVTENADLIRLAVQYKLLK